MRLVRMAYIMFHSKETLFVLCIYVHLFNTIKQSEAMDTFIVSFQSDRSWSTDQWMRYNETIVDIEKEFTICHWERLRYFSTSVNGIWAYCYIKYDSDNELQCWQLYSEANFASAGRNINFIVTSSSSSAIAEDVSYNHREWNHFCFTYSYINKAVKMYLNGKLIKADWQGDFTVIETGKSVLRSSFIIGQEPDTFEGGYDPD